MKVERLCLLILSLCVVIFEAQAAKKTQDTVDKVSNTKVDNDTDTSDNSDGDDDDSDDDLAELSMDEAIINATDNPGEFDLMYSPNAFDPKKSLIKVEYDMLFTVDEWQKRTDGMSSKKRSAPIRNGAEGGYRWTNNVVPYQFASNVFNSYQKGQILAAMRDWSRYTCLTFKESYRGNRMYFNNGGGCYSHVGMKGGAQVVGLARNCRYKHVVTHEVGHAIGLHHEQTRPDRDRYVEILYQNIPRGVQHNFRRYSWSIIQDFGVPYDYTSIMHYGAYAFSYTRGLTIRTKDSRYQNTIGRRRRLSFGDIKTVNLMYKCREANKCKLEDSDCPGDGFVGKDCKCWCPGDPYVLCSGTKTGGKKTGTKKGGKKTGTKTGGKKTGTKTGGKKTGTKTGTKTGVKTTCFDSHSRCAYWARYKQCQANPVYMYNYCKKSCGVCTKTITKPVVPTCRNLHFLCPQWAMWGYCNSFAYRSYMSQTCRLSCGFCNSQSQGVASTKPLQQCYDFDGFCKTLASYGLCQSSNVYMQSKCRKSCNWCQNSKKAPNTQGSNSNPKCRDLNKFCSDWAKKGECNRNPNYMLAYCKKSCKVKNC